MRNSTFQLSTFSCSEETHSHAFLHIADSPFYHPADSPFYHPADSPFYHPADSPFYHPPPHPLPTIGRGRPCGVAVYNYSTFNLPHLLHLINLRHLSEIPLSSSVGICHGVANPENKGKEKKKRKDNLYKSAQSVKSAVKKRKSAVKKK